MDPFVSKSNQNRILLARIVIGVGVVLAAIVVGMVVLNFMAYRNSEGLPPVDQSPAQISIGNPSEGAVLEAGESQMVSAAATGPLECNLRQVDWHNPFQRPSTGCP
jgi:hypothetical protein